MCVSHQNGWKPCWGPRDARGRRRAILSDLGANGRSEGRGCFYRGGGECQLCLPRGWKVSVKGRGEGLGWSSGASHGSRRFPQNPRIFDTFNLWPSLRLLLLGAQLAPTGLHLAQVGGTAHRAYHRATRSPLCRFAPKNKKRQPQANFKLLFGERFLLLGGVRL